MQPPVFKVNVADLKTFLMVKHMLLSDKLADFSVGVGMSGLLLVVSFVSNPEVSCLL
jgi:hypothetical protein